MIQEKRRKRSLPALALCVVAFVLFSSNEQDATSFSPFSFLRNTSTRFLSNSKKSTNDYLVVINAVAKINNLPLVEHNRRHIFKKDSWDCVIFNVATDELIPDSNDYIQKLQDELECSIIKKPGSHWGDFLMFVLPSFVSNYEYVTILLDDIYFPNEGKMALQPDKVIDKMKEMNLGSMQPVIVGDTWGVVTQFGQIKAKDCIFEAKMIELYAQFFSRDAWECFYKMLDYEGSKGWCYDLCMPTQCPDVKMAYDGRFLGYHMDREVKSVPNDSFTESGDLVISDDVKDWAPQEKVELEKSNYQTLNGFRVCQKLKCDFPWDPQYNILQCPDEVKAEER